MSPRSSAPAARLRPAPARSGARPRDARWLSEEVGRLLFRARRALWSAAAGRLEARGESVLAWQLLNQLQRCGPGTQREIAERAAQHPTGVSRLLEQLERGGFVRRRRDAADRRKVRVEITAHGVLRLEESRPEVLTAVDEVLRPLSLAERHALRALLGKLNLD
ncbi:MAG TPA: MarR family winged helix-turn-helix transcriptional regulator [Myxococcales bacterium]|jgi:DNA-binding MarR family transcriptional regulator|nr:MarR family winged helix-turn-helix transcriptional regulator [Myxococcales bacterium]